MKMLNERNHWFVSGTRYHDKLVERIWKVKNSLVSVASTEVCKWMDRVRIFPK